MKRRGVVMRGIALLTLVAFVTGCSTVVPERLATPEEAFPDKDVKTVPGDVPVDSTKKATFEASFEDVWRAANMGAAQAQLNIQTSQKSKGLILATTVKQITHSYWGNQGLKDLHTYAIVVRETGPKSTEVQVFTRMQSACEKTTVLAMIIEVVTIVMILIPPFQIAQNSACDDKATVHWATDKIQEIDQVMTFTRSNLLAAGAM